MGVPVVCVTRSVVQRRTTRWLIDGAIVLHIVNFVAVFSIPGEFSFPWNVKWTRGIVKWPIRGENA